MSILGRNYFCWRSASIFRAQRCSGLPNHQLSVTGHQLSKSSCLHANPAVSKIKRQSWYQPQNPRWPHHRYVGEILPALLLLSLFFFTVVLSFEEFFSHKILWTSAYKCNQHGGKQAAFTTSGALLWGRITFIHSSVKLNSSWKWSGPPVFTPVWW